MIKEIKLKFGKAIGLEALSMNATPITVFVGPNNSGKSKILSEINQFCASGSKNQTNVILDDLEFENIEHLKISDKISKVMLKPGAGEIIAPEQLLIGKRGQRFQVGKSQLIHTLKNVNENKPFLCTYYLSYNTIILDGSNRINLINQQAAGDLQQPPHTSFQVLLREDDKRKEVRRIVYEAFGYYLVLDPTCLGILRLRLSKKQPLNDLEEIGIHDAAVEFHASALSIDQASDGVKAFTGMIIEALAGDPAVLLIDEPEAFLHPSLANKLGMEISKLTVGSEKRFFVSTHSPNFVMGCIQSGAPINIVRLTYRDGNPTARLLHNSEILKLMRNPLLRSTGVLSALFYEYVVVAESDADRAFYQEINERLLRFTTNSGIPNCLFLNAQNKQTVKTIIKPLRQLGIPVAGIVDVDVLKEGGSVWTSFLDCGFIPALEQESLANLRSSLKKKFDESGKDMKRAGGIDVLNSGDKEAASNLLDKLSDYGLFVIKGGELESWLCSLSASGHGPSWLIEVFEKMGEDPENPNYVKPQEGDVWNFISSIRDWMMNPMKKGMPL